MRLDLLRPPTVFDPRAAEYKDWLHLNVFDHATGMVGLFNVSLHGDLEDPRSRAIGTALLHLPGKGWFGDVVVRGVDEARLGLSSIGLDEVALGVEPTSGRVHFAAQPAGSGLAVRLSAEPVSTPISIDRPLPFGDGWISWHVVPRLEVDGTIVVDGDTIELAGASAYHDHNWGRWHWGDDVGWEWGTFMAPTPGPSVVFSRATTKDHSESSAPLLVFAAGARRRTFSADAVTLELEGCFGSALRRLPGALAALHQDRVRPNLPARLRLVADDGFDRLELDFAVEAAGQLIAGDPMRPGYGFIQEMVGPFALTGRIDGTAVRHDGLGVFEYVT